MTGDQEDMLGRLKVVLPARWFADASPILDGLLSGVASAWSCVYALLDYARAQTRIATAVDVWLDMIALDFFGLRVGRRPGQADEAFRTRILQELVRERGTRRAIVSVLTDLTGRPPVIFEPARTTDTGGWRQGGLGYGKAGGWGSLALPFQCFVTAFRPHSSGIAGVTGWGGAGGGYGLGGVEYASLDMLAGSVTDADIYSAVADVLPAANIAWTRISN